MGDRRGRKSASEHRYNVLFLYTGHSARNIMAEGLLNKMGEGRFRAYSAGSHPAGKVDPRAIEKLQREGIGTEDARSRIWNEFVRAGAPAMDFVITVCGTAAGEACPAWPGEPIIGNSSA